MALYSNPHVPVTKVRDVDALHSMLEGLRVAKKNPQPIVALRAKLERAVCGEITIHVQGDMILKQAIVHVLGDTHLVA